MITTETVKYSLAFPNTNEVSIKITVGENAPIVSTTIPNITSPIVSPATTNKRYPGCDTDDIVLANGQVWSACNVGASKSYIGVSNNGNYIPAPANDTIGLYFQW